LVFTQSLERWMSDRTVRRPLSKLDFRDQLWLGPLSLTQSGIFRNLCKWRGGTCQLIKLLSQVGSTFETKAGADPSGIDQLSLFINTEDERAEPWQTFRGRCVAGNHKFLRLDAFHLEPIPVARGIVRRINELGDDPFNAILASMFEECVATAGEVFAVSKHAVTGRL